MKVLALLLRMLLGGIFVAAGVLKIWNPAMFADSISYYRLLPHAWVNLLAITLPWIEVLAGGMLMAGLWKRANAGLIAAMMVVFIIAIAQAIARDLNIECGCFGTGDGRKVGVIALVQDFVLLTGAVWLCWLDKE